MRLSIAEIIEAVDGKLIHDGQKSDVICQITTDSRVFMKQGLFIPLVGERFDAHNFLDKVYDKGAIAALTMEDKVPDQRLTMILVKDTKQALLDLAHFYRQKLAIPVVGVTGSVGKTSTKDLIAAVLSGKFKTHKTEGNFNNEIGVPLTLFRLEASDQVSVVEMGMNHFGEIHKLSTAASPDYAVITMIGTSHIENLGSREGILKAKLEILDGLSKEGLLIVNGDNDLLGTLDLPVKTVFYGLSSKNQYWAKEIVGHDTYTTAVIVTPKTTYNVRIEALGEHMVYNTLAAIVIAEHMGLTEEEIYAGLASYVPTKMRMHIESLSNGMTIIDDTYNASLDSMQAALKVLKDYQAGSRKIAVLGDMFEMGDFAPKLHEQVGKFVSQMNMDVLVAIGSLAKHIYDACEAEGNTEVYYYETKEAFIKEMKTVLQKGDTILFKASRGMHFEEMLSEVGKVN